MIYSKWGEELNIMLIHKGTQDINTDILLLRRFVESDAQHMFDNCANDPEVTKFNYCNV